MFRILLALACLVPPALLAQVSTKIDLVAWGADIPCLALGSPEKQPFVTALGFRYSEPVPYAGPLAVEIFQNAATVAEADAAMRAETEKANKNQEGRPVKVAPLPKRVANAPMARTRSWGSRGMPRRVSASPSPAAAIGFPLQVS